MAEAETAHEADGEDVGHDRGRYWAVLVLTLAVPAVLYLLTLYPGVGGRINPGDSAKFQFIGEILGVPHEPGYPQYVVLNYLWTRLPIPGELAWRVNLLSAFFALAAGALLFDTLSDITRRLAAAMLGTWAVLLSRAVWTFSTEAEVYSLNLLWVSAVLWTAWRWYRTRRRGWLIALIVVYALSFGNHPTMITLLPGLVVMLLWADRRAVLRPAVVLTVAAAVTVSLGQYGFLIWRSWSDTPHVEGIVRRAANLGDLASTMAGGRFAEDGYLLGEGPREMTRRMATFPFEVARWLAIPTALLAGFGLVHIWRREPAFGSLVVIGGLGSALFAAAYHSGDWTAYAASPWLMVAVLATVGASRGLGETRAIRVAAAAAWLVVLALQAATNLDALQVTNNRWDRTKLLREARPGSRVVTFAQNGYREILVNKYYRYTLPAGLDLELDTAQRVFKHSYSFLRHPKLYFGSKRVRGYFDRFGVDYVIRRPKRDPRFRYFVTGSSLPIDELLVQPVEGGVQLRRADGRLVIEARESIAIAVVSPSQDRVKCAFSVPLDERSATRRHPRLGRLFAELRLGDRAFAAAAGTSLQAHRGALDRIVDGLALDPDAVGEPAHGFVAWVERGGVRAEHVVVVDPTEPITLEVQR